jgi:hypothetical protein
MSSPLFRDAPEGGEMRMSLRTSLLLVALTLVGTIAVANKLIWPFQLGNWVLLAAFSSIAGLFMSQVNRARGRHQQRYSAFQTVAPPTAGKAR